MIELAKTYNPKEYEEKIYRLWEEGGYFKPEIKNIDRQSQKPFCIIMPPPNANGDLHIGHALFISIEDIMTRYHRMKGEPTLWLPGADHAGFETQVVFERKLEKEGRTRLEMSREDFYQEVWNFTMENRKNMESQMRRLGASCDWSRKKFTLDPDIIQIVYRTFKQLYEDGFIYRGERLVNYCPKHQTTFSDLEVKYEERIDPLYFIKYPIVKNSKSEARISKKSTASNFIVVATVRPETMLGDTAVAVNPNDERYKNLIGAYVKLPLTDRVIPIIADEFVDPEFGTGAVKVTPAHDMNDWEIGQRHKLPYISVITREGLMAENTGPYRGLTIKDARKKIVEDLEKFGLIEKVDQNYKHRVGVCYKCQTPIEPTILPQWFIKMKPLAEKAIDALKEGKIKIIPEHFEKIYFHWLENIKDWNISRQIWWGIPIPAWFCQKMQNDQCKMKNGIIIDIEKEPKECPYCGSTEIIKDQDTFDTWFSSAEWPYATLLTSNGNQRSETKNPKNKLGLTSDDFETFYPTSVMETGYEILFFWVARMVMLGIYMTGEIPFRVIYLHGTVRDKFKRKMSKSLGNVINPMEVIDLYGADALRMGLVVGNTPGTDLALDENKIKGYRNFANKIWNISRFILSRVDPEIFTRPLLKPQPKTDADNFILNEERLLIEDITSLMEEFRFYLAGEKIYHYAWHKLADKYIESAKSQLSDDSLKENTSIILRWLLERLLKMLHPFMPFLTETIWQNIPHKDSAPLIIQRWPEP
jgi:valyl-tRNA synthetase